MEATLERDMAEEVQMVVPAVFRIRGSDWGWYRFEDVLNLVTTIRIQQGLPGLKTEEFLERFLPSSSHPQKGRGWLEVRSRSGSFKPEWICSDTLIGIYFAYEAFVSCGWGNDVIALVRFGIVRTWVEEVHADGQSELPSSVTFPCCTGINKEGRKFSGADFFSITRT